MDTKLVRIRRATAPPRMGKQARDERHMGQVASVIGIEWALERRGDAWGVEVARELRRVMNEGHRQQAA